MLGHRLMLSPSYLAETRNLTRDETLRADPGAVPRARAAAAPGLGAGERAELGGAGRRGLASRPCRRTSRSTFPLVPRYRLSGLPFGGSPSLRRGHGSDVAGSRATSAATRSRRSTGARARGSRPPSAATSSSSGSATPTRRRASSCSPTAGPSMGVYGAPFPWLSKPDAVRSTTELIVHSAEAANAAIAYLDYADARRPRRRAVLARSERPGDVAADRGARRATRPASTRPRTGSRAALEFLPRFRSELSSGTFVFVISDFLGEAPPESAWLTAAARRWEVVPVIVQDPVWEQSFPVVGPLVLPLADPRDGQVIEVRLSRREARARRDANERRRDDLYAGFFALGLDPVLVDPRDPRRVDRIFLDWAERRRDQRAAGEPPRAPRSTRGSARRSSPRSSSAPGSAGGARRRRRAAPPPVKPLTARATLTPHPTLFGDALTAGSTCRSTPTASTPSSIKAVPASTRSSPTGAAGDHDVAAPAGTRRSATAGAPVPRRRLRAGSRGPVVIDLKPAVVTATSGGRTLKRQGRVAQTSILSRLQRRTSAATSRASAGRGPCRRRSTRSRRPGSRTCSRSLAGAARARRARRARLRARAARRAPAASGAGSCSRRSRPRSRTRATPPAAPTRPTAARRSSCSRRRSRPRASPALAGSAEDAAWSEQPPSPDRAHRARRRGRVLDEERRRELGPLHGRRRARADRGADDRPPGRARRPARGARRAPPRRGPAPAAEQAAAAPGELRRDRRARPLGEHLVRHVLAHRRRSSRTSSTRGALRARRLLDRVPGAAAGHARVGAAAADPLFTLPKQVAPGEQPTYSDQSVDEVVHRAARRSRAGSSSPDRSSATAT